MAVVREETCACNVAKDKVGAVFIKEEEENQQTRPGGLWEAEGGERESAEKH